MHINNITSAVLLSLASASIILAAPSTSKRAADLGIIFPLHCVGGDCADCPSLPPCEESNVELAIRNVDAVPGCPFNCNEDGCDLCAPPSQFEMSKEKREEAGLISVRYVKRVEDVICVPGQPPPIGDVLVCTGFGCVPCLPEGDKEKIKRDEMDLIPMRYVKRVEDVICVPGQPPPNGAVLVCTGIGCVPCPPEAEKANAKREEDHICTTPPKRDCEDASCIHCNPPPEVPMVQVKRGQHGCIPHCLSHHIIPPNPFHLPHSPLNPASPLH